MRPLRSPHAVARDRDRWNLHISFPFEKISVAHYEMRKLLEIRSWSDDLSEKLYQSRDQINMWILKALLLFQEGETNLSSKLI